jgi:putative hydrolase of the HAD superfamily
MRDERPIPLFDLGNVVVKVDFTPFVSWLAERSGPGDPARAAALLSSPLLSELECGRLTPAAFAQAVRADHDASFTQAELEERFCAIFPGEVPGMPALLEELAGRGPVYCLSNTNEIHLSYLRARHPEVLRPFTGLFVSHELGMRKPSPDVYREVAGRIGAPAERIVFFDDLAVNVEGARLAGLEAHLFREAGQVRMRLEGLKEFQGLDDKNKHGG